MKYDAYNILIAHMMNNKKKLDNHYYKMIFINLVIAIVIFIFLYVAIDYGYKHDHFTIKNAGIEVRDSSIADRGVFANKYFTKGSVVEICPCLKDKDRNFKGILADYVFMYDDEHSILPLGYCAILNHSETPNVMWQLHPMKNDMMQLIAIRDIIPGEELFHDYGDEYWDGRKHIAQNVNNISSGY